MGQCCLRRRDEPECDEHSELLPRTCWGMIADRKRREPYVPRGMSIELGDERAMLTSAPQTFGVSEEAASPLNPSSRRYLYTLRHGHRVDAFDDSWTSQSDRPYDPPLTEEGKQCAYNTA
eukprot:Sspe_Gene.35346::Locus_17134_Transcript_1_1_Confidence_1.000_Length_513::g.35346::m.35346